MEHYLEAHHSPDLFHVQHELVKAVSGLMATKERAAHKAVTEAGEQLEQGPTHPQSTGDELAKLLEPAIERLGYEYRTSR